MSSKMDCYKMSQQEVEKMQAAGAFPMIPENVVVYKVYYGETHRVSQYNFGAYEGAQFGYYFHVKGTDTTVEVPISDWNDYSETFVGRSASDIYADIAVFLNTYVN